MRDQLPALKYLAEKQYERFEREHKRDLILASLIAPIMSGVIVAAMTLLFLYV
jgi:hypothetical protein